MDFFLNENDLNALIPAVLDKINFLGQFLYDDDSQENTNFQVKVIQDRLKELLDRFEEGLKELEEE